MQLISLWASGNPFKRNHHHDFAWLSAMDTTFPSAKTRSAICFSATCQEGQRAQRAGAEVDILGGVIFGKIFVVASGQRVHSSPKLYTSHWVWLLGCSFALDCESEYKLHSTVLFKMPHSLVEIVMIYPGRNHNCINSLSSRNWHGTPTPSHVASSTGTVSAAQ